jgi:hypothetical protein
MNNRGIIILTARILFCRLKLIPLITLAVRSQVKHAVNQSQIEIRNPSRKSNVKQPTKRS